MAFGSRVCGILAALGLGLAALPAHAGPASFLPETGAVCRAPIATTERAGRLPGSLLGALSLVESGRWHPDLKESFAWPWTVTSGKTTHYFADKAAAVAQVRRMQSRGIRNIDVGCMQINLGYHGDAFASLEDALDPEQNVAYAARFLSQLHNQTRSWIRSIERYHSGTPALGHAYRERVQKLWPIERARAADQRRREVVAAYEVRRAAREAQVDEARRRQAARANRS